MSVRRRPAAVGSEALGHEDEASNVYASVHPSSSLSRRLLSSIFASDARVWAMCAAFRAINALLVQTYFNPDEHWQALEVAHRVVFGYGHLTWEWKEGIRGYLHPLIFALLYKIMALLRFDIPWFMVKAPRLLQSTFSSVGDLYLYKLSRLVFNEQVAQWSILCQIINWFVFFCTTRTLSNSLETVLTVMGLFYWFFSQSSSSQIHFSSRKLALFIAALACAIRPTSAITWLYVGFSDLLEMQNKFGFLLLEVLPIGALVLSITCFLDRMMYGYWILVPLNFLRFNFLDSGGDYYGTHKWHWYLTQGFPAMMWSFLPFSLVGIIKSKKWKLSGLIVWVLGVYSVLGHKEFRFVLPVLPIALMFSGYSLATFSKSMSSELKRKASKNNFTWPSKVTLAIIVLVATNLPMSLYMSLVHQRGSEAAMYFLSTEAHYGKVKEILFLMPCHSTPYYSTLHMNLPMRFMDCSPREIKGMMDESNRFMSEPAGFVSHMFQNTSLPSHVVLFNSQEIGLRRILFSHSYIEVKRFFHSHFKVDRERQANVVIYALSNG